MAKKPLLTLQSKRPGCIAGPFNRYDALGWLWYFGAV